MLLVTFSPGGSLPFCFSRSSSKVLALRRRASSRLPAVCVSLLTPCRWPAGSLCWWRLPSIQNFSHLTFAKKVSDCDREPGRKGIFLFELEQLQRACSLYWQLILVPQLGYDRYVDGWILKLFYPTDPPRNTDRPTLESPRKMPNFRKSLLAQRRVF